MNVNYVDNCLPRAQYRALKRNTDAFVVEDGKTAFRAGVSPDRCPYLSVDNEHSVYLFDWLLGWGLAYRRYAESGSTPAWNTSTLNVRGKND